MAVCCQHHVTAGDIRVSVANEEKSFHFPIFCQQSKLELNATVNEMKLESTVESSCILITNLKEELQVVVVILMLSSISLFAIARHFKQSSLKLCV